MSVRMIMLSSLAGYADVAIPGPSPRSAPMYSFPMLGRGKHEGQSASTSGPGRALVPQTASENLGCGEPWFGNLGTCESGMRAELKLRAQRVSTSGI